MRLLEEACHEGHQCTLTGQERIGLERYQGVVPRAIHEALQDMSIERSPVQCRRVRRHRRMSNSSFQAQPCRWC
jgi:hypothetical protein